MTYCLAMKLADGLVFLSDSRTNAGVDHIATFRKMYRFTKPGESALVLLSSGNLGTTQQVVQLLSKQQESGRWDEASDLHEIASLIGTTLRDVVKEYAQHDNIDFRANFIFGGQRHGEQPELFHIYPEGNFIAATVETPYFLIGESKYGKPIIDRIIQYHTNLDTAARCALISMDSTIRSNLSVGLPLDLLCYQKDSLDTNCHAEIAEGNPEFERLRKAWSQGIQNAFEQMPPVKFF